MMKCESMVDVNWRKWHDSLAHLSQLSGYFWWKMKTTTDWILLKKTALLCVKLKITDHWLKAVQNII